MSNMIHVQKAPKQDQWWNITVLHIPDSGSAVESKTFRLSSDEITQIVDGIENYNGPFAIYRINSKGDT